MISFVLYTYFVRFDGAIRNKWMNENEYDEHEQIRFQTIVTIDWNEIELLINERERILLISNNFLFVYSLIKKNIQWILLIQHVQLIMKGFLDQEQSYVLVFDNVYLSS